MQTKTSNASPVTDRMVGARLDNSHRDMLAKILRANKRKFRGQLELWIETENRILLSR